MCSIVLLIWIDCEVIVFFYCYFGLRCIVVIYFSVIKIDVVDDKFL